ncbi:hypothetical protein KFL_008620020 [Klebsormidium nitens]|uniref:Uncharacterized protein n=1 Tax=Klebsormidium nitens TaxID=105231 RepID=A0A1Y1IT34_KLENI|nr:hypothetical protein KFL_008620020 [Klebsormidium nitens]|eukprot:GAQ91817.1 hypothetical protein KFL_008620020 [Klebsormidium nitens]
MKVKQNGDERSGHSPGSADEDGRRTREKHGGAWRSEKARLLQLLRSTQEELEARAEALADCQAQLADGLIAQAEERDGPATLAGLAVDLKDRLRFSHCLARKLRQERNASVLKYEEAVRHAEDAVAAAGALEGVVAQQRGELERLHDRLRSAESAESAAAAGWRAAVGQLEEQAALHQQRAELQDQRAAALEDALKRETGRTTQAEAEAASALAVCEEQRGVIAELELAVAGAREDAAAVAAAGAEWRRQQLSTDQVWADNARLAALLQHGPYFQTLLQELEDADGGVYLPATQDGAAELQALLDKYADSSDRVPIVPGREGANWVPAEAFDLVASFCAAHVPALPLPPLHGLLVRLNAVWRRQEQRKLARAKAGHAKRTADLRRQLQQTRPYHDVVGTCRDGRPKVAASSAKEDSPRRRDSFRPWSPSYLSERY